MKKSVILYLMLIFTLISCRSGKSLTAQTQEYKRDSVRVEYREHTVFVPDTVYLEIPRQAAERTTADSTSHMENDYAITDARINADGTLWHILLSKPQKRAIPTSKPIVYRDSLIYRDRAALKHNIIHKYVERNLSWWEQTQIYGFWAAIIVVAITYRKKIFQTVVRLFLKK